MGNFIEEELRDLPQEWIELLNQMPKIKEQIVRDKKVNKYEMISPYFFSYFMDDYKLCESFFCFERGKEVFNNLFELYGKSETAESIVKDLNEDELKKLIIKHINGINYLLKMKDEKTYDIRNMEIRELTGEQFEDDYDANDIEDSDIRDSCNEAMIYDVLPKDDENPIAAFDEALYELTLDYNIIYYILWSLGKIDDVDNPYKSYVELWKRGLKPYIIDENLLVVVR